MKEVVEQLKEIKRSVANGNTMSVLNLDKTDLLIELLIAKTAAELVQMRYDTCPMMNDEEKSKSRQAKIINEAIRLFEDR